MELSIGMVLLKLPRHSRTELHLQVNGQFLPSIGLIMSFQSLKTLLELIIIIPMSASSI